MLPKSATKYSIWSELRAFHDDLWATFLDPGSRLASLVSRNSCNREKCYCWQREGTARCVLSQLLRLRPGSAEFGKLATGERMDFRSISSPFPLHCSQSQSLFCHIHHGAFWYYVIKVNGSWIYGTSDASWRYLSLRIRESVTERMKRDESTVTKLTNTPRGLFMLRVAFVRNGSRYNFKLSKINFKDVISVNTAALGMTKEARTPCQADWRSWINEIRFVFDFK